MTYLNWLRDLADALDPPPGVQVEVRPITMEDTAAQAILRADDLNDALVRMRAGIRDVLATNSVLIADDVNDEQIVAALEHTFGKPGLAEQLLMAIKRTGAVTAYRDLVDETVRVRVAVTRRDREAWPQSPTGPEVPSTVELDADAETVVRRMIDPEYAAAPPLPKEPEVQYSRLAPVPVAGDTAWSAFLEDDPVTEEQPSQAPATMGSALLGVRAYGAPDPRKAHTYIESNDDKDSPCVSCGLTLSAGPHGVDA